MEYSQDQLFHDLEQRYVSLKHERDAIYNENKALKGLLQFVTFVWYINCIDVVSVTIEKLDAVNKVHSDLKGHSDTMQRELAHKDSVIAQV